MNCKDCMFYRKSGAFKFGECSQVDAISESKPEEVGMKLNPDRIYDEGKYGGWREGDYIKPTFVPDEESTVVVDKMLVWSGGGYDSFYVGENFGCIHFKQKE